MRKILTLPLAALAAIAIYMMSSEGGGANPAMAPSDVGSVIVIGDKRFLTQLDDMAMNAKNYAGKTVRLEGFTLLLEKGSPWRFAVARIFSCCGPDGYPVGLPCAYSGEIPNEDAWIEVEGKFHVDGKNNPYLEVVKLTIKASPGRRNVFS